MHRYLAPLLMFAVALSLLIEDSRRSALQLRHERDATVNAFRTTATETIAALEALRTANDALRAARAKVLLAASIDQLDSLLAYAPAPPASAANALRQQAREIQEASLSLQSATAQAEAAASAATAARERLATALAVPSQPSKESSGTPWLVLFAGVAATVSVATLLLAIKKDRREAEEARLKILDLQNKLEEFSMRRVPK